MKRHRYHLVFSLLLGLAGAAEAQTPSVTPVDPQALDSTRQLLDWLGIDGLIEQTPQIVDQALQSEAKFRNATPAQQAEWRKQLAAKINPTTLRERVARRVVQQLDTPTLQQALALLQAPLPRRARYFELALAQAGAGRGFQVFRAGLDAEPPAPARRQLIRTISTAAGSAELLAQWQTAISAEVERSASGNSPAAAASAEASKERERYLAPLAEVYALYAYRYLTDEELATYRDTLSSAAIQRVLEVCHRNLAQAFTE
jgi:hypothetical protein